MNRCDKEPPWEFLRNHDRCDEGISVDEAPLRNSRYWDGGSTTEERLEALMLRWKLRDLDNPPGYFGDTLMSMWREEEQTRPTGADSNAEQYRDPCELIEAEVAPIEVVKTEKEETEVPNGIEVLKTEKEETEAPSEVEETAEEETEAPIEVVKTEKEETEAPSEVEETAE